MDVVVEFFFYVLLVTFGFLFFVFVLRQVADELVKEFKLDPSILYDEKNIRRRIYDALNVLMAMDIITRDKKNIRS